MQITLLNNLFLIVTAALGLLSIFILWVFVIESKKGILVSQLATYAKYANIFYITSTILCVALWLCVRGIAETVIYMLAVGMMLWLISAVAFLIMSIAAKKSNSQIRFEMRNAMENAVKKCIILLVFVWLLNV